MNPEIQFETPENVRITYEPSGLGTRLIAWMLDFLILAIVFTFCSCIGFILLDLYLQQRNLDDPETAMFYYAATANAMFALVSIVYFTLCELFMRGQSLGKRLLNVRVVKANGFSLDAGSIFVRNIFRIVDQLPWLWIVPVLSRRRQRFGDMVGGTVVVSDAPQRILRVREELAGRTAVDARYRFDHAALGRLRPVDLTAVEQLVDRWDDVPDEQLRSLLEMIIDPLAERLRMESPPVPERLQFLEDLLAAEYRRQSRSLA